MPLTRIRTDDLLSGSVANGTLNATAITGHAAATSADDADLVLIYDDNASALRKMTRANFTSGITGDVTAVTAGAGLQGGGNSGDVTVAISSATVPDLTGSNTFSGANTFSENVSITGPSLFLSASVSDFTATGSVKFNAGLSGSLTRLTDGSSYLAGGTNVTITSASNGQVVIGTSGGNTLDAAYDEGGAGLGRFITASNGPIDIQASSDSNSATELLTLAISGSVTGTDAGPRIMFKIPYSDEAYTGAAIDAIKNQSGENNSTTELRFYASGDNQTLDDKMIVTPEGVGIAGGAGTAIPYLGSGNHAFYISTTGDASTLTIKALDGKIGIGTDDPGYNLEIQESTTSTDPMVQIRQDSTGDAAIGWQLGTSLSYSMGIDNSDNDKLKIGYYAGAGAYVSTNTRLTIDRHGNIGIGESDPQYMIHAASSGSVGLFLEADTDNSTESDNPFIKLSQDNTAVQSIIGLCGATDKDPENVTYTGVVNNNMLIGTTTDYGLQLGTNDIVRMTIANSGEITYPYQPAFNVTLASDSSTSFIPDGSWATVEFTGEVFDVGSDFGSYTFTAPVAGKYLLTTSVRINSLSFTASYYWLRISTSNRNYYGTILDSNDLDNSTNIEYHTFNLTVLADMDASDTATVDLSRLGGSATAVVEGNASTATVYTMFHGYLVS